MEASNSAGTIPAFTEGMNKEQQLFESGIRSLSRAHQHLVAKSLNKIMYNVEVLVFCLWWLGAVAISTETHFLFH
jgi:hypothetical protein